MYRPVATAISRPMVEKARCSACGSPVRDRYRNDIPSRTMAVGPALPGRAEYLTALDEAVHAAIGGKKSPAEALSEAAAKWHEITERLGMERQPNRLSPQPRLVEKRSRGGIRSRSGYKIEGIKYKVCHCFAERVSGNWN